MIILDLASFVSLCWLFANVMLNLAADLEKTINSAGEIVDLRPEQKRGRLMWLGLASLIPMLTLLLHVILFFARIH
jgi:hypothetical protein